MPLPTTRRRLGRSSVEVTRLGLGCAPIGNLYSPVAEEEASDAIDAAWDLGIRYFDTAPLYGHGLSESRLGAALRRRPRGEFVLSTKVGRLLVPRRGAGAPTIFADTPDREPVFDFSGDAIERSLDESLRRLGLDRIDVALVHDPDDHLEPAIREAMPRLARLRDEGRIRAIGAGMNQSAALARIVDQCDVDCVLLAGRYTLLDQSALDDLLPRCESRDVSVIAAGVFNSGILAADLSASESATYDYLPAPRERLAQARRLSDACAASGSTLLSAALRFPLGHPSVACVLTGARTATELRANVAAFAEPPASEPWSALRHAGLVDPRAPLPEDLP